MYDACPQILNYYYKTATKYDMIVCGLSGLGYILPELFTESAGGNEYLMTFTKKTDSYLWKTGMNFVTIYNPLAEKQKDIFEEKIGSLIGYSAITNRIDISAIRNDYNKIAEFGSLYINESDPRGSDISSFFWDIMKYVDGENPYFMVMSIDPWVTKIEDIVNEANNIKKYYGDKFEFVRTDHLSMLYAKHVGAPYNLALRAKNVTASGEDKPAVNAVDGSFAKDKGWEASGNDDEWLMIDFEEEYNFSRYVLKNAHAGYYSKDLNTKRFKLQASSNGKDWTDIDTVSNNSDSIIDKKVDDFIARYVRIYITNAGADNVARVQEI